MRIAEHWRLAFKNISCEMQWRSFWTGANLAVYLLFEPGYCFGYESFHGGHLTHGSQLIFQEKFIAVEYGVTEYRNN